MGCSAVRLLGCSAVVVALAARAACATCPGASRSNRSAPAHAGAGPRCRHQARKETENIMDAIRAGIVTPGSKAALEAAEAGVTATTEALAAIERFKPSKALPRAREISRELADRLASIDDVSGAETKNAGLAGVCQLTLVAGARFELATFGL